MPVTEIVIGSIGFGAERTRYGSLGLVTLQYANRVESNKNQTALRWRVLL